MSRTSGDRRRRVLTEEVIRTPSASQADDGNAAAAGSAYPKDALRRQRRVTELAPLKGLTIALVLFVAAAAVAGVVALDAYRHHWQGMFSAGNLRAFDIAAPGSVAAWLSVFLLGLISGLALVIYAVRQHREDDYRGRYRVWMRASIGWVLYSLVSTTGLHLLLTDLWRHAPTVNRWITADYAWLIGGGILLGGIGGRLLFEVRPSGISLAALIAALCSWIVCGAATAGWVTFASVPVDRLAGTALLAGHVFLLASLLAYARHVVLEAGGKIKPRVRVEKRSAQKESSSKAGGSNSKGSGDRENQQTSRQKKLQTKQPLRVANTEPADEQPTDPKSTPATKDSPKQTEHGDDDDEDDNEGGQRRRLSKAERRRLRKERARQSRAA